MGNEQAPSQGDIFAVLDSPQSAKAVSAPVDRNEARLLKAAHTFHCSSQLGGCGTELTFAIGELYRPHFRHRPGSRCALQSSTSAADRYTHLAIQNALQEWILAMPGFDCRLEVVIDEGRTDILASGPGFEVSLEVQRSQLTPQRAKDRTERYRRRASAVDWLYETDAIDACKAEIAERGYALLVWWGWKKKECRIGVRYQTGDGVEPVMLSKGGPLAEWSLTVSGLASGHLEAARKAARDRAAALRRAKEDEAAEQERQDKRRQERIAAARERDRNQKAADLTRFAESLRRVPEGMAERWPTRWPPLTGSPAQVQWASALRARMVGLLRDDIVMPWLDDEAGFRVAAWLAAQTDAKFWIDCCGKQIELINLLMRYEDLTGERLLPR